MHALHNTPRARRNRETRRRESESGIYIIYCYYYFYAIYYVPAALYQQRARTRTDFFNLIDLVSSLLGVPGSAPLL